jgi:hypothetical protein
VRVDDIFICTPPKCGTTWTQAICALLIFETLDFGGKLTNISPWFDSKLESLDICMATLESQTHRRFVKTHTPLDGVPYFPGCEYLIVYRDPRDAYFSVRNHLLNMVNPPEIPQLATDPRDGFRAWLDSPFEPGLGEQRSLEAFTQHFESYWKYRHLENFHFFHFADMKRDLPASVRRISDILEIRVSEERLDEICDAASFAEMKRKASSYAPASGKSFFKSDEAFFSSGRNAQWRDVLGAREIGRYNVRINELLSPDDVEWVENGYDEQHENDEPPNKHTRSRRGEGEDVE